jgi:hypothetical protein
VSDAVLDGGLRAYVNQHGPFDVALIGPATPFLADGDDANNDAVNFLRRYASHRLSNQALSAFFIDVRANFGKLPVAIRLVSTLNFDYYAATKKQVEVLLNQSIAVLGPNHQFVSALSDLPEFAKREKHYSRKATLLTDDWRRFLLQHPERVVTTTHFVGPHEYCFDPIAVRPYEIAVPGAEYVLRQDAARRLKRTPLRSAPKTYFHLFRLASRLGVPVYSHPLTLRLYNLLFQRTLAESRCVYTARGGFGMPIRKFFEIPAAGSLLVCSPCNGYADLGFEPGRHYVRAEPEDLLLALREWLPDPKAQEIAAAGQHLVVTNHSLTARGEQIERCLRAMISGTYLGSHWQRGEFVINTKSQCVV